jgi:hypothetical protein
MSSLLGAAFLLYLVIAPSTEPDSNQLLSGFNWTDVVTNKQTVFHKNNVSLLVTGFTENEILTDLEINYAINRNTNDFRQTLNRTTYVLTIPTIGFGVLMYSIKCFITVSRQRPSVLSISIGGHAPPKERKDFFHYIIHQKGYKQ